MPQILSREALKVLARMRVARLAAADARKRVDPMAARVVRLKDDTCLSGVRLDHRLRRPAIDDPPELLAEPVCDNTSPKDRTRTFRNPISYTEGEFEAMRDWYANIRRAEN